MAIGSIRWLPTMALFALFVFSMPRSALGQSPQAEQHAQDAPQSEASQPSPDPSLLTPLRTPPEDAPYDPITPRQRVRWVVTVSIGPAHLVGGLFSAGLGTALDRPPEDGPHWGGFGDRYGMRFTSLVPGNIFEAGLGSIRGEDPRYFRIPDEHFGARMKNVIKQTLEARRADGTFAPAYARFIAIPASNFLSNAWRPKGEANDRDAAFRSLEGLAGRMAANAFEEIWPDVRAHVFHRID